MIEMSGAIPTITSFADRHSIIGGPKIGHEDQQWAGHRSLPGPALAVLRGFRLGTRSQHQ